MEKDTLDYIKNKSYIELSIEERESMKDLFSTEDEFNAIKIMLSQIDGVVNDTEQPSNQVKKSLDEVFIQHYPASQSKSFLALIVPKNKPIYRQPLVQIAALVILLLLIVPMFNSSLVEETIRVAELNEKDDVEMIEPSSSENKVLEESSTDEKVENKTQIMKKEQKLTPQKSKNSRKKKTTVKSIEIQAAIPPVLIESSPNVMFDHPDGIYVPEKNEAIFYSTSLNETEDLLDLLTVTF